MEMELQVRLFARAKDLAGHDSVVVRLAGDTPNVGELKRALSEQFPQLTAIVPHLHVAIGTDYAKDTTPLSSADSVSCFPPVSGG